MKIVSYLFLKDLEEGVLEITTKKINGKYHLLTKFFKFNTKYQKNNWKVENHGHNNPIQVHEDFIKKLKGG